MNRMYIAYKTPHSNDGTIYEVNSDSSKNYIINVKFQPPQRFIDRIDGDVNNLTFATRSRIAQLGINIKPISEIIFDRNNAYLKVSVKSLIKKKYFNDYIKQAFIPGLKVGRLVFCDPAKLLTTENIYSFLQKNYFHLPAPLSINTKGQLFINPHRRVYEIEHNITFEEFLTIITREDGKYILKRLQIIRPIKDIILNPGFAVITSCSMFLQKHFVVLETANSNLGEHLNSTVLDPIITRGNRIYLEFYNPTNTIIVNPTALATIYEADEVKEESKVYVGPTQKREKEQDYEDKEEFSFRMLSNFYNEFFGEESKKAYQERPILVLGNNFELQNQNNETDSQRVAFNNVDATIELLVARVSSSEMEPRKHKIDSLFKDIREDEKSTVFLKYFPNNYEHLSLCQAALDNKIERIVFRHASFEHGPFLSMRDHSRLADYRDFGIEVLWCNDWLHHVAKHVFMGYRGYFVPQTKIERFKDSLIFAIYGSTFPLPNDQIDHLEKLIEKLCSFFGDNLTFLTGGGPGAMKTIVDLAEQNKIFTGASFLEIDNWSKESNLNVDFYQTFQFNERHLRQRWFEIANLHIFLIGGLGTLEEIGLTLTDMKLGVTDQGPLIFWGKQEGELYWKDLVSQLNKVLKSERGPDWLSENILISNNPDDVIPFYKNAYEIN